MFVDLQAHRRTHNKEPRKPRTKKKTDKSSSSPTPTFEVVEMIKSEDLDIPFEDETYEAEFITDWELSTVIDFNQLIGLVH